MANKKMVREWFLFAIRGYKMAQGLLNLDAKQYKSGVAYHSQQCAEKAIKGLLVFYDIRPKFKHDLAELADQVKEIDSKIAIEILKANRLTDFAVGYRYPDAQKSPMTVAKAKTALKLAKQVYDLCYGRVYKS